MCSRVLDVVHVATALDLEDLLSALKLTLREMNADTDLDTVYLGTSLKVSIVKNTLSDGSVTFGLRMVPVEIE